MRKTNVGETEAIFTNCAVVDGEASLSITNFCPTCKEKKKDAVKTLNQMTISTAFQAAMNICRNTLAGLEFLTTRKFPCLTAFAT